MKKLLLLASCAALSLGDLRAASPVPLHAAPAPVATPAYADLSREDNERIAWWVDARYGMFIHWGVASILGVDLSWGRRGSRPLDIFKDGPGYVEDPVYDHLYRSWYPAAFDAREWARVAKEAGMKYMVLTAKHHDGFCLWDTKTTDYGIMHTPFKRDVVKEFVSACREAGLKVGLYYSQRDWHHPEYGIGDNKAYVSYMNEQLTELLTNYGPIDILWFDSYGRGDLKTFWGIEETWNLVKKLAPTAVINNRLAVLAAYNNQGKPFWGDFDTPEQRIGGMQTERAWESCMTLVDHQWGYKPRGDMYSLPKVIQSLVYCAAGDGNLLLNTGPMPDGRIEPRQAERLREAGAWLARYGHTIYGTRGGPYHPARWGGSTRKGSTVYIHVLEWNNQERLRLAPIPEKVLSARALNGASVEVRQTEQGLDIAVPAAQRDAIDTIIELTLDRAPSSIVKGHAVRSMFEDGMLGGPITQGAAIGVFPAPADAADLERLLDPANRKAIACAQTMNPSITLDLGRVRTLKGVRIEPANGSDPTLGSLVALVSRDGSTWTEIWKCKEPDQLFEFPVTALVAGAQVAGVPARYVKFEIQSKKPARFALNHVQLHGE